jgi:glycosyltransferase involved in cell wall biosynthesis
MTGKITIWYLIPSLNHGGAEKTLVDLVNNLSPSEYDITIWTIQDEGYFRTQIPEYVTYRSINANNKMDLPSTSRFFRACIQDHPDIIQSFLFFDNILARLTNIFTKDLIVIGGVRSVPNNRPILREVIDRITLPLSDHIVSNSTAGKKWAQEKGVSDQKVSGRHNGRDFKTYNTANASPELRNEFGLGDGPVLGTVGRLVMRKGHYDLLEALPRIVNEYPNVTLLLVGDGPEREGLESRAESLDCRDNVVFAGMRDDIPELLDLMDVFVFPSHYEGLPGALLEAMMAGLPIVATPVDGNKDLINDGITGLFIPPNDSKRITKRILQLLSDPGLQQELGDSASKFAKKEFTIEHMVLEFKDLYELLLHN